MSIQKRNKFTITIPNEGKLQGEVVAMSASFRLVQELLDRKRVSKHTISTSRGLKIRMGNLTMQDYTGDFTEDAIRLSKAIKHANETNMKKVPAILIFMNERCVSIGYMNAKHAEYEADLLAHLLSKNPLCKKCENFTVTRIVGHTLIGVSIDIERLIKDGVCEPDLHGSLCGIELSDKRLVLMNENGSMLSTGCLSRKRMMDSLVEGYQLVAPYMITPAPKPARY